MDDAVIPHKWLGAPIADLDALIAANRAAVSTPWFIANHPELDTAAPLDFGYCHLEWSNLRHRMREGDQLYEYSSLIAEGGAPAEAGIALVREGMPIAYVEMIQFHRQFDWRLVDLSFTSRPDRENADDGAGNPITFEYFLAPLSEVCSFSSFPKVCSFCGQRRRCFSLGCAECLKKGEFTVWHGTEYGFLDDQDEAGEELEGVSPQARIALSRTPSYRSAQEEEWLICCEDFMVYLGDWAPAHFHYIAPDGDGKALFRRIAGDECRSWWDRAPIRILGGHSPSSWGDSNCHVFRCRHCRKFRLYFAFY